MHLPLRRTPTSRNKALFVTAALAWLFVPAGLSAQAPAPAAPAAPAVAAEKNPVFEEWTAIIMDGKQCGNGHTVTTRIDTATGPHYQTVHRDEFVLKRMDLEMTIVENFDVTEDADGGVLSFKASTSGLGSDMETSGVREGDELVVTGHDQTQRYPIPRLAALGPDKIRRMTEAVPLKPGQAFSFNTFSTDYPQAVVVVKGVVVDQEDHDVRGTSRKLWKTTAETSIMPGTIATTWIDDKSQEVETVMDIPGIGTMHEYTTNRTESSGPLQGVEAMATSQIRPQREIPSPSDQAQAIYRLTAIDPSKKIGLWNEGEQRILSTTADSCEVEVTAQRFTPDDATWQLPHADTPELHPYLQASSYLEVNSPEVQALAKQAVGDQKNPVLAAFAIEDFVRSYIIHKDLNVAFGSARETAISREGDCTEHAVLCAALGRAVGLPTRCVVGLGYLPPGIESPTLGAAENNTTGIFEFHMWAEAWIGPGRWVPMDAALNGFDVSHIAITKTALKDINPLIDLDTPVLQLVENIKIDVERVVPRGQPVLIPPTTLEAVPPAALPTPIVTPAPAPTTPVPATTPTGSGASSVD